MGVSLLPNAALAVAYLRRLGYSAAEAASLVERQPLKGGNGKPLLSELAIRHVLTIPFENLEQHVVQLPGASLQPTSLEERLQRLGQIQTTVERLATGVRGGVCFDLNPAFAWLLRELGAKARLAMAVVHANGDFMEDATHCVILVDLPSETLLVDPGFGDPVRVAVAMEGPTQERLATYEMASQEDARGFTTVLRRKRDADSMCLHLAQIDDSSLDTAEADWQPLYAFRPDDDLSYDNQEFRDGLTSIRDTESLFAAKKFICLGLVKGYITLSEKRLRRVEGSEVTEEVAVEDEGCWQSLAGRIFGLPLLSPVTAKDLSPAPAAKPTASAGYGGAACGFAPKTQASRETATQNAKNLGTIDAKSIAVGGAGAGGGLGLNRPGFGPKVQHFSGGATAQKKSIEVSEDIRSAWSKVMDDSDSTSWIYCSYSVDGKALELTGSGTSGLQEFKTALGNSIAWGGFRCYGVDKRGGLVCKRPKFIFVQHKPEHASAMKKAKQGSHKGDVKEVITGTHLDLIVENLDDLDEQSLIAKLQAATGAHKPNGYEFDEDNFIEADFYGLGIGKDCRGEGSKN